MLCIKSTSRVCPSTRTLPERIDGVASGSMFRRVWLGHGTATMPSPCAWAVGMGGGSAWLFNVILQPGQRSADPAPCRERPPGHARRWRENARPARYPFMGMPARYARPLYPPPASSRIITAAFSPVMMPGALVLPATTRGLIEASATHSPPTHALATANRPRCSGRSPCGVRGGPEIPKRHPGIEPAAPTR